MTSVGDKAYIAKLHEDAAKHLPLTNVEQYREALPKILEDRKNREPLPTIGSYHSAVDLGDGLTAAIGVPPLGTEKPFPVILFCHGHGGLAGSPHSYRRHTHDLAAAGYLTITPDYRKAPEFKHPVGLDDLLSAALWIKKNAEAYGGDGSSIVVSGDSVGATLAAVTMLRLLEEPEGPAVKAFVGLEGFYERGPDAMPFILEAYLPEGFTDKDLQHPWVSPTNGFKAGETYPPILLITGSGDFAAPSTMRFAQSLFEKSIPFQLHVLEDMPHDFMKMVDMDGYQEGHTLMLDWLAKHI